MTHDGEAQQLHRVSQIQDVLDQGTSVPLRMVAANGSVWAKAAQVGNDRSGTEEARAGENVTSPRIGRQHDARRTGGRAKSRHSQRSTAKSVLEMLGVSPVAMKGTYSVFFDAQPPDMVAPFRDEQNRGRGAFLHVAHETSGCGRVLMIRAG